MSGVGLGGTLQRVGLKNLSALGEVESEARDLAFKQQRAQNVAQNQAIGGLVGSLMGVGKGAYQSYKAGEQQADVRNAEAARSQFPDEASYQASIKKNYSPEVRREMAVRATIPQDLRETYGLEDPPPQWAWDMAQQTLKLKHLFE